MPGILVDLTDGHGKGFSSPKEKQCVKGHQGHRHQSQQSTGQAQDRHGTTNLESWEGLFHGGELNCVKSCRVEG